MHCTSCKSRAPSSSTCGSASRKSANTSIPKSFWRFETDSHVDPGSTHPSHSTSTISPSRSTRRFYLAIVGASWDTLLSSISLALDAFHQDDLPDETGYMRTLDKLILRGEIVDRNVGEQPTRRHVPSTCTEYTGILLQRQWNENRQHSYGFTQGIGMRLHSRGFSNLEFSSGKANKQICEFQFQFCSPRSRAECFLIGRLLQHNRKIRMCLFSFRQGSYR